jgi:hypothetical protein
MHYLESRTVQYINPVAIYFTIQPSPSLQKSCRHSQHLQILRGNRRSRNIYFFIKTCIDFPPRISSPVSDGIEIPFKISPKKSPSRAVSSNRSQETKTTANFEPSFRSLNHQRTKTKELSVHFDRIPTSPPELGPTLLAMFLEFLGHSSSTETAAREFEATAPGRKVKR